MKTCVLCGLPFVGYGNNPEPVEPLDKGRCCDPCNQRAVIPARIRRLEMNLPMRDAGEDE